MGFFDLFRKKYSQKVEGYFIDKKRCINCGALISNDEKICKFCHHNQENSVTIKQLDILTAVNYALYYDAKLHNSLSERAKEFITEFSAKNKYLPIIINELFFMQLSLLYILFLSHFEKHRKYKAIVDEYQSRIEKLLSDLFEHDNLGDIVAFFYTRVEQFSKAYASQDPIKTIAKMLQLIIELHVCYDENNPMKEALMSENLNMTAEIYAMPSIRHFMPCFIYVSNVISAYKAMLNKWEIK
jgi:RNA polymerase subunit RPABC4/transcription elongation factor Spt4